MSTKKPKSIIEINEKIQSALAPELSLEDKFSDLSHSQLIEELYIYQAELLAQNDELQKKNYKLAKILEENEYLFNKAPIAYIIINKDFGIIKINTLAHKTFSKFKSWTNNLLVHTLLSREVFHEIFKWSIKDRWLFESIDLKIPTNQGLRWFSIACSLLENENYLLALSDIHTKKEQEELAKSQREELETIFNTSKDGIALLDLESNFMRVNKAYTTITGYKEEELLQKSCIGMSIPEDIIKTQEAIAVVLEKGFIENFEKSCYNKDGSVFTISMSVALMPEKQALLITAKM